MKDRSPAAPAAGGGRWESKVSRSVTIAAICLAVAGPAAASHTVDDSYTVARRFADYRAHYPGIRVPVLAPRSGQTMAFDLTYKSVGERDLHIDVFAPAPAMRRNQGLLLAHGGAWRSGSKAHLYALANLLAQRGITVFLPEYRLTPEARYPAGMDDIRDALAWAQQHAGGYGLGRDRIAIGGTSSGGQMASLLAYRDTATPLPGRTPPNALIDIDGVLDATTPLALQYENAAGAASPLAQWLGGSFEQAPDVWRGASAARYAGPQSPPTLIVGSGMARFTAGREAVLATLARHGVPTATYTFTDVPHDIWLFEPYLDRVAMEIDGFLRTVAADMRSHRR